MDVSDYESLPDGMGKKELREIYQQFFSEAGYEPIKLTMEKLEILCDKQWHTYELPDSEVKRSLSDWLKKNRPHSQEFFDLVLGVCYCFGLSKSLYRKALVNYAGEDKEEYEQYLDKSPGDDIDPYSTMRNLEKDQE